MNLRQLNEKVQEVNAKEAFVEFAKDNNKIFTDGLKDQLYLGESGTGLMPFYSSVEYSKEKNLMNPDANKRMDFYYTGAFYKGFYVNVDISGLSFYSTDSKAGELTAKARRSGQNIWIYGNTATDIVVGEIINNGFKNYLI